MASPIEADRGRLRQACDLCRSRKTRCDRLSPCSSCTALKVKCKTSERPQEKRQRVLLSAKYDDTIQDISSQILDIKDLVQSLVTRSEQQPHNVTNPRIASRTSYALDIETGESFKGDSSFSAHADRVKSALEAAYTPSPGQEDRGSSTPLSMVHGLIQDVGAEGPVKQKSTTKANECPFEGIEGMYLPPVDTVLALLRQMRVRRFRFFVDLPIIDLDEFIDLCREIYFATEAYHFWTWLTVNVGLYFCFLEVTDADTSHSGLSSAAVQQAVDSLHAYLKGATRELRLCSQPTLEACRALALLFTFHIKDGESEYAWRLVVAAARCCLDLGMHRLPYDPSQPDGDHARATFWYIYTWDKGMAFTCGKTPTIHHYDVTTQHLEQHQSPSESPQRLLSKWFELAELVSEVYRHLFSASSKRKGLRASRDKANDLIERSLLLRKSIQAESSDDPTWDSMYEPVAIALDIAINSLLVIIYRTLPPESLNSHPLQCCSDCVETARAGLAKIVAAGRYFAQRSSLGWAMLLNIILAMVPCISVLVLVGNAIATCSDGDFELISAAVEVLGIAAPHSTTIRKLQEVCDKFLQVATLIVSGNPSSQDRSAANQFPTAGVPQPDDERLFEDYLPMSQQDWNAVMGDMGVESVDWDAEMMAGILEPYMPAP